MKFCKPHWIDLKEKIRERGLEPFIAQGGQEVVRRMSGGEFEPLAMAHVRIMENLLRDIPPILFIEGCPICWANEWHNTTCTDPECKGPDPFNEYIIFAADEQLAIAKELGLIMSA